MLGKESIHAVVLGVFSAAIMSDDITEKFKFKRVRSFFPLIFKEIAILMLIYCVRSNICFVSCKFLD